MVCITEAITLKETDGSGYTVAIPFLVSIDDYRDIKERAEISGKSIEELLILLEAKKLSP